MEAEGSALDTGHLSLLQPVKVGTTLAATAAHLSSDEEMSVDAAHERAGHLISDLLICKLKGCVLEPKLLHKVR